MMNQQLRLIDDENCYLCRRPPRPLPYPPHIIVVIVSNDDWMPSLPPQPPGTLGQKRSFSSSFSLVIVAAVLLTVPVVPSSSSRPPGSWLVFFLAPFGLTVGGRGWDDGYHDVVKSSIETLWQQGSHIRVRHQGCGGHQQRRPPLTTTDSSPTYNRQGGHDTVTASIAVFDTMLDQDIFHFNPHVLDPIQQQKNGAIKPTE